MKDKVKPIADVQAQTDSRHIAINRAGIRRLKHPVSIDSGDGATTATVAEFAMSVDLPADQKGTHMSRFVELLNEREIRIGAQEIGQLMTQMVKKLGAHNGHLQITLPYFRKKTAPVSAVDSLMDYELSLTSRLKDGRSHTALRIVVPVTSLCPCSKKVADYGAHNQRSHVTVYADYDKDETLDSIIDTVEAQASSELYAVLKREDEKYVTEKAYDNPKFVEDLIRDLATELTGARINWQRIEVENFESIHNHSAFARLDRN